MIYKYIMIYCLSCKKPTKDVNVKPKQKTLYNS